jgi:hypothetical protein
MLQVYHFLSAGMEEKSNEAGEKSRVGELIPPCQVSLVTTQNEASEDALVEQGLRRTPPPGPPGELPGATWVKDNRCPETTLRDNA